MNERYNGRKYNVYHPSITPVACNNDNNIERNPRKRNGIILVNHHPSNSGFLQGECKIFQLKHPPNVNKKRNAVTGIKSVYPSTIFFKYKMKRIEVDNNVQGNNDKHPRLFEK